uniref:TANC1/2-like winged helix domain-containing protein n=1 Tax=Ditylenchus dipsaci TaxID=166011 RepID=A0A915DFV5_9BILA
MIEEDRIRLKATSLSLLPTDLNQLYLLHFNLNFTSLSLFHMVAPILSVILASLKPMRFKELLMVLNAGQSEPRVSEKELNQRLGLLSPMIVKLSSGVYVPLHQSFREWLLKESSETDYFVDVRQGNLQSEHLFELGHHLLKANPHKYLQLGVAPDMPTDRGAQIAWIRMAAAVNNITEALLFSRNTFYPIQRSGNCDMLQLLLQYGADIEYVHPETGETPLIVAVKHKHFEATRLLHTSTARLDVVDRQGNCALVHAAQAAARLGKVRICRYLLDCTDATLDTSSAMCTACASGQSEVVQFLLSRGATLSPNQSWNGKSALICAVESGSWDLVVNVLKHCLGGSEHHKHLHQPTIDSTYGGCKQMLTASEKVVEEEDSDHAVEDDTDLDLLFEVILSASKKRKFSYEKPKRGMSKYNSKWTEKLKGHYITASDKSKEHFSCVACGNENLLLGKRREKEIIQHLGSRSHKNGHVGLVDLLINRGAALDVQDANGKTAIMHAIEGKNTESKANTAALLIDRGCDITAKDLRDNTLIHLLARNPNKCLINRLLKLGLSLEDKNCEELRAIEVAIKFNSQIAIDAFLASGARLRSLTWQIALECNPELLLVLTKSSLHRYNYALQKCTELLDKCEQEGGEQEEDSEQEANIIVHSVSKEELNKRCIQLHFPLSSIQSQLRQYKLQTLFSIAYLKRKNNELR